MRFKRQLWRLALVLVPLGFLGTGCSGINATGSMSPASFFMPGLVQEEKSTVEEPVAATPAVDEGLLVAKR